MANVITTAYVNEYRQNVQQLAQQDGSKMYGKVRVEAQVAESLFYDQLDRVDMRPKDQASDRNAATVIDNPPHFRRQNVMSNWVTSAAIDDEDIVRTLNDFQSPYAIAQGMAAGRQIDKLVIDAVFGTSLVQEDNTPGVATNIVWDTWATANPAHLIGSAIGASATTGMTLAKLISAKKTLDGADLVNPGRLCIAMTELQIAELLADPQLTSQDYNSVKNLVAGDIDQFMGLSFIEISSNATARPQGGDLGTPGTPEALLPVDAVATDTRRCFAFSENHLLLGMGKDISVSVARSIDYNDMWRIVTKMIGGATRLEEKGFVEVRCLE